MKLKELFLENDDGRLASVDNALELGQWYMHSALELLQNAQQNPEIIRSPEASKLIKDLSRIIPRLDKARQMLKSR